MTDFSMPNATPGKCVKCKGSGEYCWGAVVNGKPTHKGRCHSCQGTGRQDAAQIKRNETYNRHKVVTI